MHLVTALSTKFVSGLADLENSDVLTVSNAFSMNSLTLANTMQCYLRERDVIQEDMMMMRMMKVILLCSMTSQIN